MLADFGRGTVRRLLDVRIRLVSAWCNHRFGRVSDVVPISAATADIYRRALDARDARFDGIFFVGITTTGVYCRPVCPARVAYHSHRRFFETAASAEHAGFRPCLRCRPELAPGRALMDAVPRLARVAALRINAGALNGRSVADLASELGVSERHLRRALEREVGVSPLELALTQRLLLARHLLADTTLSVTRVAFASGFQSLRRFNAVFRERYGLSPSGVRRARGPIPRRTRDVPADDQVALAVAYRPPLAWGVLLAELRREALPGVDRIAANQYARTVEVEGHKGIIVADDAHHAHANERKPRAHLTVRVSTALLPALMPLLARVRQLFDLDAEPTVVDAHLAQSGLAHMVRRRPGLRLPGAFDAFEVALRALLASDSAVSSRVVRELGEPIETGIPELTHMSPTPARVVQAGETRLVDLGVSRTSARVLVALARALSSGALRLHTGDAPDTARRELLAIDGVDEQLATTLVMHALHWPDAFPTRDRDLQRATGAASERALSVASQRWRPWRAYAAMHLRLDAADSPAHARQSIVSA